MKSKKNRVKKAKDEGVREAPVPQEAAQRSYSAPWPRESDVERSERREVRAVSSSVSSSDVTDSVAEKNSVSEPVPAAPPPNLANDFPALPGGGKKAHIKKSSSKIPEENNAQSLPCTWSKVVNKASDIAVDNTGASNDHEDNNKDLCSEQNDKTITVINECDEIKAVIDSDVPKESEEVDDSDDADTVVSVTNNPNDITLNCDEDVPIDITEVVATEEEFDRKETNKEKPIVIFSENPQEWKSAEIDFGFGFDVDEDLVARAAMAAPAEDNVEFVAAPPPQPQPAPAQFWHGAMDSMDNIAMDNAILSFGAAGPVPHDPAMRPLIVGVPVGVPIPVTGFYPHQMVAGAPVLQYPPIYNIPFPHQMSAEEDHEIMAEKMIGGDRNHEDHTISPESGISSSSPLSWQPDSSPSLPAASKCHLPLASQVSQSLSQWPGHASDHEDTEPAPGWATQVEAEVDTSGGQDSGLASGNSSSSSAQGPHQNKKTEKFNFVEIVNFISNTWSNVSEDTNVQVFSAKA